MEVGNKKNLLYVCRKIRVLTKPPLRMKKLYHFCQVFCALVLVFFFASNSFAQIVVTADNPYNEGFESLGLSNWTTEAVAGSDVWADTYSEHHTGSKSINYSSSLFGDFMNMDFDNLDFLELFEVLSDMQNIGNGSARFISPVFDLSGLGNSATLKFYRKQVTSLMPQTLSVYYRTSPSGNWVYLQQFTNTASSWTEETVSLPNISSTYQIAFLGLFDAESASADLDIMSLMMGGENMDFSSNIYLDDVYVGSGSGSSSSCDPPQNLSISYITATTANVNWGGTADNWTVEYGPVGFSHGNGTTVTAQNPLYTIANLTPNTTYDVYVRSNCGSNSSNWVNTSFTTANQNGVNENSDVLSVYPNPTTDIVRCTFKGNLANTRLQVLDVYGKLLMEQNVTEATTEINLSDKASGIYFLRVVDGNNVLTTQKVVRR